MSFIKVKNDTDGDILIRAVDIRSVKHELITGNYVAGTYKLIKTGRWPFRSLIEQQITKPSFDSCEGCCIMTIDRTFISKSTVEEVEALLIEALND